MIDNCITANLQLVLSVVNVFGTCEKKKGKNINWDEIKMNNLEIAAPGHLFL